MPKGTSTPQNNNVTPPANPADLTLIKVDTERDFPEWLTMDALVSFFHNKMKPYHDTPADVRRGLAYALSEEPGMGGFVVVASRGHEVLGGLTMLHTGMKGYIPENLLLFVAVDPVLRGQGIGGRIIRESLKYCDGAVKLHVEPDNPAGRLYQRLGFETKYHEMRLPDAAQGVGQ